ncbi:MAG: tyrosine recombinase [Turicibacter sp.]|nr:tyrosine recombinase [Turicibacter sp.]
MQGNVEQFLLCLQVERWYSPTTLGGYRYSLGQYVRFLSARGVKCLSEVKHETLQAYVREMHGFGMAANTVCRHLAAISGLHDFLNVEKLSKTPNPCRLLGRPKIPKRLPRWLGLGEVLAILSPPRETCPLNLRNIAMLEILYGSGLRASELVSLTFDNLHLTKRLLRFVGKGNRERIVPMSAVSVTAINDYLEMGRPRLASGKTPYVFLNHLGNRLTRQGLWHIVKKTGLQAGLNKSVSPHMFRHSFATHLLENGASLVDIQQMLGHKSLATTEVYTHLSIHHLRIAISEAHPRSPKRSNFPQGEDALSTSPGAAPQDVTKNRKPKLPFIMSIE